MGGYGSKDFGGDAVNDRVVIVDYPTKCCNRDDQISLCKLNLRIKIRQIDLPCIFTWSRTSGRGVRYLEWSVE